MFIDKDKFGRDNKKTLYTEHTQTINALVDIFKRNIKQIVKNKPWSALNGRVTRGSQLSPSAHKDLPLPATTPLTR